MRTIFNFGFFMALCYTSFVSSWAVEFSCGRLRASHWYTSDSGCGLADLPKQRLRPCLFTCRLGPSASSARVLTGQKLTNGVYFMVYDDRWTGKDLDGIIRGSIEAAYHNLPWQTNGDHKKKTLSRASRWPAPDSKHKSPTHRPYGVTTTPIPSI
jgi:hypothetical protein